MQTRVVILTNHSLFAEGIISRLTQQPESVDLQVVDLCQPDALAQAIAACPVAIILDDSDPGALEPLTLGKLLQLLPVLVIIRLNLQKQLVEVVRCEQHMVYEARDLIQLIETAVSLQEKKW